MKSKRLLLIKYALIALLACACWGGELSARAASITFSTPVTCSADTDVSTDGTFLSAYSLNAGAVTINGVAFANGSGSLTTLGTYFSMTAFSAHYNGFGGGANSPYDTLSANYQTLLANGDYVGNLATAPVITLQNLTVGHQYAVQVWVNDSRGVRTTANTATIASVGNSVDLQYNSAGTLGGVGQFTIGTFVADGTTQTFTIIGSNGMSDTYMNAIQLRGLGAVPPSNIGYWNGLGGSVLNYNSLNFCTNDYTAPLGTAASLATVAALSNACFFGDVYYNNSVATAVTISNVTVAAGGVAIGSVNFRNSTALDYTLNSADANGLTGATAVNQFGSGTVILAGENTYSGGTAIAGGTVQVGAGGTSGSLGTGPVTDYGALVFNRSDSPTITNDISGSGTLTQAGSGTLNLSAVNTYTGGTAISAGTLAIGGDGQLGGGSYGGPITDNGNFVYQSTADQTSSSSISGTGMVTQAGSGTLTLTATSTFTGQVAVNGGSLRCEGPAANGVFPTAASMTVNNGGTLVSGANGLVGYNTHRVPFFVNAGGTLTVDGGAGGGPNIYGPITLAGGTIADGGSLHPTYGSYNFGGGIIIATGATVSTISAQDFQFRIPTTVQVDSGAILDVSGYFSPLGHSGAFTLTKTGAGTLVLAGANTYGSTIVSNGTLEVDGSLPASALTVTIGTTLTGTGTINGPTTIQAGGTVELGTNISALSISSSLNLAGNAILKITKTGGTPASDNFTGMSAVTYGGTLTVTNITSDATALAEGDTFTLFTIASGSYSGAFTVFNLPPLPAGLNWDKSQLTVNGKIAVVSSVPTPIFSPAAGGYEGALSVTISSAAGATIYYTTDGSTPTTSSPSGLSPVTGIIVPANTNMTITAFATKAGSANSPVASATYATVTTPTWINPNGGSWASAANWSNNVVASGSGATADFSTLTLPGSPFVTLDGAFTIGKMVFGDIGNTYTWEIDPGSGGPLTLDAGTNSPTITVNNTTTTLTVPLAGTAGLTKNGNGILDLTVNEPYTGTTIVNAGSLQLDFAGSSTYFNQSTLQGALVVNSGATCWLNQPYALGIGGGLTNIYLNGGTLGGPGNCPVVGLSFQLSGGTINIAGSLYLGETTGFPPVTFGSFSNVLTSVVAPGGGLSLRGTFGQQDYVIAVERGATTNGVDLEIDADIGESSGPCSVVKAGAGTLALDGTSSYTGSTVVTNGTLFVNGSLSAASAVTVASAGTLGGTGTVGGAVTVNGVLTPGTNGLGTLAITNALTLNAGSMTKLAIDRASGTATYGNVQGITTASLGGTLTVTSLGGTFQAGDTFTLFSGSTSTGDFTVKNLPALAPAWSGSGVLPAGRCRWWLA